MSFSERVYNRMRHRWTYNEKTETQQLGIKATVAIRYINYHRCSKSATKHTFKSKPQLHFKQHCPPTQWQMNFLIKTS